MNEMLLIKLGEIVLKGLNRKSFEAVLLKTIRYRLADAGDFEVQDVGDEQRENQLQRYGHKRIGEGHLQRLDVLRLGKCVDVILETDDILHALEQIVIREAVHQRGYERIELKDAEADQPRQDQDKAHVALLQLAQPAPLSEVLARGGRSLRHRVSPFPS